MRPALCLDCALRLLAEIAPDARAERAQPLAEMARLRAVLAENDIDEVSVHDLVSAHLGKAFGLERVGGLRIAGNQGLARIRRPAVRGAKHHLALEEIIGYQDHGEGG